MMESDRIITQVQWLDRAAKLALIGGFALPPIVVGILIALGWPLGALGGILVVGCGAPWGCFFCSRPRASGSQRKHIWRASLSIAASDPERSSWSRCFSGS